MRIIPQKTCRHCLQNKPLEEFHSNSRAMDGLDHRCRACRREFDRKRRLTEKYREAERKRKASEDYLKRTRERAKRRYATDEWYHNDAYRALMRKYRQSPERKDRIALNSRRRRDRQRGLENTLTYNEWLEIVHSQQSCCLACGRAFDLELKPTRDHIDPDKGLTKENCQALCGPCNSSKGARYIDYRT